MGATLIEKIIARHSEKRTPRPGDIVDLRLDARVARDFGGANVVKNIEDARLDVDDPERTFFTFDCNPGGSDQGYAANQQRCRLFARERGIAVYDIDRGIGTHVAIEAGLAWPGSTFVSTDSHANILGAVGAFGQGMGDADIAGAFAQGKVWFEVPPTVRVIFDGQPAANCTAKDLVLAACGQLGAKGLLGCAAEVCGDAIDALGLAGRMTLASMATEMGAITLLVPPNEEVETFCRERTNGSSHARGWEPIFADGNARYLREVYVDVAGLTPLVARPGHPDDVMAVHRIEPTAIDSAFIGSCTNGRLADIRAAAEVLRGRKVAKGVVLKIVPATDEVWRAALQEGLWDVLKSAGALVGNAGCAGCAAGQIGQNGPGETTVSSGNRNFPGKQGRGEVYLASPRTVAASAVAGQLVTAEQLDQGRVPARPSAPLASERSAAPERSLEAKEERPHVLRGRAWVVDIDSIDTDMIFHNRHLAETDPAKMGQHAFGNLPGWEDFPARAEAGDIIVTGANFGCGSSRQQAVGCFQSLGVAALVAKSFGAIYERNAINEAMPALRCDWPAGAVENGDELVLDLESGRIENVTRSSELTARPLSPVQLQIYRRGGLLVPTG